jgi:hypothetical protein
MFVICITEKKQVSQRQVAQIQMGQCSKKAAHREAEHMGMGYGYGYDLPAARDHCSPSDLQDMKSLVTTTSEKRRRKSPTPIPFIVA